ncbi:hypothetical protein [Streptomyces sp. NBC_00328]|uniref:hypothetical protein n=1 Tax=Streptomyces sp. NBC_00328 TaxID=2903646 RepID=UPI002E283AAF|nr:hypothetical protein [Streptomyces sp. NBC_00328]
MATDADIALLLAEAADEVEIGIAPYQAVLRGGRRRKARRWALVAAAALVVAGSTGTLALAGGTDDHGGRVEPAVTAPSTPEQRHVYEPQRTTLATAWDHGKEWNLDVSIWGAPENEAEAQYQRAGMSDYALTPTGTQVASDLIGKGWVFVRLAVGDDSPATVLDGPVEKGDSFSGTDIEAAAVPLRTGRAGTAGAYRLLVIGKVATTAREVTCRWDDGTSTRVPMAPEGAGFTMEFKPMIRRVAGSSANWFVCLAPVGTNYKSAAVTR